MSHIHDGHTRYYSDASDGVFSNAEWHPAARRASASPPEANALGLSGVAEPCLFGNGHSPSSLHSSQTANDQHALSWKSGVHCQQGPLRSLYPSASDGHHTHHSSESLASLDAYQSLRTNDGYANETRYLVPDPCASTDSWVAHNEQDGKVNTQDDYTEAARMAAEFMHDPLDISPASQPLQIPAMTSNQLPFFSSHAVGAVPHQTSGIRGQLDNWSFPRGPHLTFSQDCQGYRSNLNTPESEIPPVPDLHGESRTNSFSSSNPLTPAHAVLEAGYFGGSDLGKQMRHGSIQSTAMRQPAYNVSSSLSASTSDLLGTLSIRSPPMIQPAAIMPDFFPPPLATFDEAYEGLTAQQAAQCQKIRAWLNSSNKLNLGTQVTLSFSGKLAQRSYNKEKRFLAPPPHLLVLGSTERTLSAVCSIVHTETKVSTYVATQQIADSIGTSSKLFSHRIYAKNPFVPATEKTAKTAMSAITLGVNDVDDADFEGRKYYGSVMTTVSKPAKRKAPAKLSEFHVIHGSLVCIGNRQRAQTASTRYLCATDDSAFEPLREMASLNGQIGGIANGDSAWHDNLGTHPHMWDPYIVYIVDPQLPTKGVAHAPPMHTDPSFPPMPHNAVPYHEYEPRPIRHNQLVVLQSYSTGKRSPIFVIRDVKEREHCMFGLDFDHNDRDSDNENCAPGEMLGDPLTHLQKVAFQFLGGVEQALKSGRTDSRVFLACDGANIANSRLEASKRRVYETRKKTDSSKKSTHGRKKSIPDTPPMSRHASLADLHESRNTSPSASPSMSYKFPNSSPYSPRPRQSSVSQPEPDCSANGGKVLKHKRNSSIGALPPLLTSSVLARGANHARRSSLSISMTMSQVDEEEPIDLPRVFAHDEEATCRYSIKLDVGFIWTISGVSYSRYTMVPSNNIETFRDDEPLVACVVHGQDVDKRSFPMAPAGDWICLQGHGLDNDLLIWFDDIPANVTPTDDCYELYATLPDLKGSLTPKRIILSTPAGTLYPTDHYYSPR